MKRRDFLKAGAAGMTGSLVAGLGLIQWTPRAHAATINKTYYITDGFITQPDGVDVYFKGFSNSPGSVTVPGEQLVVQQGDTVNITIVNTLSSSHSFVIDGVVDSGRIRGGETAVVSFTADTPGSYLFYDNRNAPYNRLLGLHGGFAVMPAGSSNELYPGSPTFVQQYFWVLNDIDPVWHNELRNGRTPSSRFLPYYFTINGRSMRVPGHPDYGNPDIDAGYNPQTRLTGSVGDRTLIRVLHAGLCVHSMHWHANHVEWLTRNGEILEDIWKKDTIMVPNNMGKLDVIYPFEAPPDAYPPVTTGSYPMHLHDEMTQTAGGGMYQFGIATTIAFR